jgi:uncharacterized protein YndB with AHSA1/START domain
MTAAIMPAPVRKSIRVEAPPQRAFEIFTANMGRWWPRTHSINKFSPIADVVVEPRSGGRWYERGEDGSECSWGEVLAWEPPSRLVLAWQISAQWQYDPNLLTEVEVRFVPEGASATRVELEHRHLERYGEAAEGVRGMFESPAGWSGVLESFAASATA